MKAVGARLPRYDGVGHVTGRTQYVDDVRVGRTLWVKALRSPHHHAAITKLLTSKAEAVKGVHAIITAADVPRNVYGHLEGLGVPGDEPLLADGEVRYKGQPIAAVAAESEEAAQAAVEAIEIAFDERPALFDIRLALDPDAPQIHQWGNVYPHYGPYNTAAYARATSTGRSKRPTRSSKASTARRRSSRCRWRRRSASPFRRRAAG